MKLEFRDGEHEIPDHLANLMAGLDTYQMTVDEATDAANKQMLKQHLDKAMDDVISNHMKNLDYMR